MKIGVLGTGDVGKALGAGFVMLGHEVKMGSRSAANEKALAWARQMGPKASVATFADAAAFGDIVVLAVLGVANESALKLAEPENFRGKVVIDANTVGNPFMFRPEFPGGPPDMFICGNSDEAKKTVAEILQDFGWGVVDLGGIEGARYLEAMCIVWVRAAMSSGNWNQAFKLLRK